MTTLEDEQFEFCLEFCKEYVKLLEIVEIAKRIINLNHHWNVPNLPKKYDNVMFELETEVSNLNKLDSSGGK